MSEDTDAVERMLSKSRPDAIPSEDLLSSGHTIFNLACSGRIDGAFPKGTYTHFVGGSDSGKTFLSYTTLAEAAINPLFDEYELIYDPVENGDLMDIQKFWGPRLSARIHTPGKDGTHSKTVQELYHHIDDVRNSGKPCVYVADSMASLQDQADIENFDKNKKLYRAGKDEEGTYGMGKSKANSKNLPWVVDWLESTGSILLIINQTRDKIGFGAQFNPNTVGGGRALKFYAHLEIWAAATGQINRTVNGKQRQIGINAEMRVKKNRINGRVRSADVSILHSFGVDDIGDCIDFLVEEKYWKKEKGSSDIEAKEFAVLSREKLVHMIENEGAEKELRMIVQRVWNDIEEACVVDRKPRYT